MGGAAFFRRVWVLMAIVFVDMVGYLVVLPLLPFYAEKMGASESLIGVLIAVFAFAQLTTAPLWGKLSDHYGRRPMLLLGLLLSAAAFVLFGLAQSVLLLLLSRVVQGVGAGTVGVIQAYVSDSAAPRDRTQALGWVTVATSAGVMVGPALGSLAILLDESAPGFIAAGLCLLNLLFAWRHLPESFRGGGDIPSGGQRPGSRSLRHAIRHVLRHPGTPLATLIWVYAFGMMAFMAMNGVIALYLERVFQVTEKTIGWFYFYMGGVSTLMRGLVLGPVVRRLGDIRTLRLGALSIAVGMGTIPLAGDLPSLAAAAIFVPVGTALLFPATTSLVSQLSPADEVGQNLGVQQGFGGVARMIGPLWAAAVFQYLSIASPFWIASGLMLLVLTLALRVRSGRAPKTRADSLLEAEAPAQESP